MRRVFTAALAALLCFASITLPSSSGNDRVSAAAEEPTAYVDTTVQVEAFVSRFYGLCLGRTPDPVGLTDWTVRLLDGSNTGAQIAYGFINSQEFLTRNVSNDEYIRTLYAAFFDRVADDVGYAAWMSALDAGLSRFYVLKGFTDSVEFGNLCARFSITQGTLTASEAYDMYPDIARFVIRFYRNCLGREADPAGLNDWILRLANKSSKGVDIAKGFVFSAEFLAKGTTDTAFIEILYATFFDRTADPTGMQTWQSQLDNGYERLSILAGFVNSAEFANLAARFGIETGYLDPLVVSSDPNAPLAAYARSFIGIKYTYAGSTPSSGFDCSGFVCYVYKTKYGITLPHGSYYICNKGTAVSAADIKPGDVLCYDYSGDGIMDHVALYIGNGRMVHASTRRNSIVEDPVDTAGAKTIRRFL